MTRHSLRHRPVFLAGLTGVVALLSIVTVAATEHEEPPPPPPPPPLAQAITQTSATEVSPGVIVQEWSGAEVPFAMQVAQLAPSARPRFRPVMSNDLVAEPNESDRLETTQSMCERNHCVVAINADQWIVENGGPLRKLPIGGTAIAGELVNSPRLRPYRHANFIQGGAIEMLTDLPEINISLEASNLVLNVTDFNRDGEGTSVSMLTTRFGPSSNTGAEEPHWVVDFPDGMVDGGRVEVGERRVGAGPVPEGGAVIYGRGSSQSQVDDFFVFGGDSATLTFDPGPIHHLIGGTSALLIDGVYGFVPESDDGRQPRTILGWNDSGEVFMVTMDGRQSTWSVGANRKEAADIMTRLGATNALNLDGGGSTTFIQGNTVANRPSDSGRRPRSVVSALVVGPPEGFEFGVASAGSIDGPCPAADVKRDHFADVNSDNVHHFPVDCLASRKITGGLGDGNYGPDQSVSREQMATFLVRLLEQSGMSLPAGSDAFSDDDSSVHEDNINRLAAAGIVSGRADGTYGPKGRVTRSQMSAFLVRTYQVRTATTITPTADYFVDDSLNVHERSINAAADLQLVAGKTVDRFDPEAGVRRDQMASFVLRTLAAL